MDIVGQNRIWLGLEFDENSDSFGPTTWIDTEDGSSLQDDQYLPWHVINWEGSYNGNDIVGPGYINDSTGPNDDKLNRRNPFHRASTPPYGDGTSFAQWLVTLRTDEEEYASSRLDCLCRYRIPGETMIHWKIHTPKFGISA